MVTRTRTVAAVSWWLAAMLVIAPVTRVAAEETGDARLKALEQQLKRTMDELERQKKLTEDAQRAIRELRSQMHEVRAAGAPAEKGTAAQPVVAAPVEEQIHRDVQAEVARQIAPTKEAQAQQAAAGQPVIVTFSKSGLQLGGINVKLGGFIEAVGIYRTRNEVADVGSDYNTGIPFRNDPKAHENETRLSARQSRLSLLVTGDVSRDTHLGAYYEMDFLSSGTTSNSRESNSYTPRSRHLYATLDDDEWGFHLLVGQNWSLLTTNTKGIIPRQEQIPLTIDAQYVEGFNWLRVPQFRVVGNFGPAVWAGVSAESPQMVTSPITAPGGVNFNNSGNSGGLLNSTTTYSNDYIPDVVGKVAFEPGWGHYELKGLVRTFTARADGGNHSTTGYGFGGAAAFPIVPQFLEVQLSGLAGYGIGRYASGQLPDAAFRRDNKHLEAIPELQGLVGIIAHPWVGNDTYVYGGWEHADRAGTPSLIVDSSGKFVGASGYGSNQLDVSGCDVEGGTCRAQTENLQQITAGFWQDVYKGNYGRFTVGFQGGEIWRDGFSGVGGKTPRTNIGIFMTGFRYYPFN